MTEGAEDAQEKVEILPLLSAPRAKSVLFIETKDQLNSAILELASGAGPFAVDAERASG
ncbi:MAG: hypothetical protein RLZZ594_661, partial [Actinomycetota bacterium]